MAKNTLSYEQHIYDWADSSPSGKFLTKGTSIVIGICTVIGFLMLLIGAILIFTVDDSSQSITSKLSKIDTANTLILIGGFISILQVLFNFFTFGGTVALKNALKANKVNTYPSLAEYSGAKLSIVQRGRYNMLSFATCADKDKSIIGNYFLSTLFSAISEILSEVAILLFATSIADNVSKLIVLGIKISASQLEALLAGWLIPAILLGLWLVFRIISFVIRNSIVKKCTAIIDAESKKSGNAPKSVFSYNQPKTATTATTPTTSQTTTTKDKLTELKSLKEQGLITEEQYNEAVNKQLNNL